MTEITTIIPARLKSGVVGGHVTGAADIIDDDKGKTQDVINADVDTAIGDDDVEGSIKGRIKSLEEAVGPGGSVEEQIDAKVATLDASVSQAAGADGLALSVTEADGKLTGISGSIAANTYDTYGSAAAEATRAQSAESTLDGKISAEKTRAEGAEAALQTNITAEETRATAAESGLQDNIDTEEARAKAAEEANASAIATEKTRAEGAESTLTTNLAAEVTRAQGAESALSTSISNEATRAQGAESTLQGNIDAEETRAKAAEAQNAGDIDAIELKIPTQASSTNQLADKEFVNSSVSTSTATFRGTSATGLTEEQFLAWANALTKDDNDYVFWNTADAAGNVQFKRYKYNGTAWVYEYTLNNSSFTSEQWTAINSGITDTLTGKLSALPTNAELTTALNGKQAVISDLDTIRSGASAGATAYQKPSTGIPSTDLTSAAQTSLGKADTAVQPSALDDYYDKDATDNLLDAKQDTLVSGTNIKTINNNSLLGSGNIEITGNTADVNYDTTNKKITKTINGVTSDVVTAATIVTDGGAALLPEVEIGETAPTEDVKLFVDTDADPSVSIDVYTRAQTDVMLAGKADKTAAVSSVTYDSSTNMLKQTINGVTTNITPVVQSGFVPQFNGTTGIMELNSVGGATIAPNATTGIIEMTF